MTESKIPMQLRGECVMLAARTIGGECPLSESINNYKFLLFTVFNDYTDAAELTGLVPVSIFKLYTTIEHSFGMNGFNDGGRIYGYAHYVSDTKVVLQLPSGRGMVIYGIR